MSEFKELKQRLTARFNELSAHTLLRVDLHKYELVYTYLDSFTDPVERQYHNCNCCKEFLHRYGGIVAVVNGEMQTIWDFEAPASYDKLPKIMGDLVRSAKIKEMFMTHEPYMGIDHNFKLLENGTSKRWDHFAAITPDWSVRPKDVSIDTMLGEQRATREVFQRALETITITACDEVLELISQNSLYRGAEFKATIESFLNFKIAYLAAENKELYFWGNLGKMSRIRNTAIGTLLVDISEGMKLDKAVGKFEAMVAPANYRRPTALVTPAMISLAEAKIKELGYEDALYRRYAGLSDIPISEVLHVNRDSKKALGLFDELKEQINVDISKFDKIEEVPIDKFISDVLPNLTEVEVLLENKQASNFMSLTTAVHADAPVLFNWGSPVAWSYADGLADSVKERIKAAGGNVEGVLRVSLDWFNYDDLDLSVIEPDGYTIYFGDKVSRITGGFLDVDMNASVGKSREAVENIIYNRQPPNGIYTIRVTNYNKRENIDFGFNIEVEYQGNLTRISSSQPVKDGKVINVATLTIKGGVGELVTHYGDSNKQANSKEIWGLSSCRFHKVSLILDSPNHWNKEVGNKHTFFILEGAKNPAAPRGIFNEFLKSELQPHRKVFELLGSKMKVPEADEQLSGLGFSSTQRADVILRVTGKVKRTIKVKF